MKIYASMCIRLADEDFHVHHCFILLQNEDALSKLELEFELQRQITSAALRLAQDKGLSKYVRKQRKQSYTKALNKVSLWMAA